MKETRIAEIGEISYTAVFENDVLQEVSVKIGNASDLMSPDDVASLVKWLSEKVLMKPKQEPTKVNITTNLEDMSNRKVGIPGVQVFDMSDKIITKETVKFTVPKNV